MAEPVAPDERGVTLDILRGLALCGVLIANMLHLFSGRAHGRVLDTELVDVVAAHAINVGVASKAMTLLTCLFGFGFAMQLARAEQRGEAVQTLFVRRMLALFLMGWSHVTLLWWGDVTWGYALAGLSLLAFQRTQTRTLLVLAAVLVLVPSTVMRIPAIAEPWARLVWHSAPSRFSPELVAAIEGSSYLHTIGAHAREAAMFSSLIAPWYLPWLVGHFLLGFVAGRHQIFALEGRAHLHLFRRLLVWGVVLALVALALRTLQVTGLLRVPASARVALSVVGEVGVLAHTAVYVAAIVLLVQRDRVRRWLAIVAPVGRMPLTTYLTQSLFCTFLFYGWGIGLAGKLGAAACLAIAIAIYGVQIAIAHAWLRRYRFGPAEWLWRTLAYGKRPAMRR